MESDGLTATEGDDFGAFPIAVSFGADDIETQVSIPIIDDTIVESEPNPKTLRFTIDPLGFGDVDPSEVAEICINDDDGECRI